MRACLKIYFRRVCGKQLMEMCFWARFHCKSGVRKALVSEFREIMNSGKDNGIKGQLSIGMCAKGTLGGVSLKVNFQTIDRNACQRHAERCKNENSGSGRGRLCGVGKRHIVVTT